jgi:hypothetical protein
MTVSQAKYKVSKGTKDMQGERKRHIQDEDLSVHLSEHLLPQVCCGALPLQCLLKLAQ